MEKQVSLKKLSEIDDNLELWRGTKIRIMLEDNYYDTDHFDYMLIQAPGDHSHMILVNITDGNYKEGAVFASKVEITGKKAVTVNKNSLQKALGDYFENSYLLYRYEDNIE